MAQESFQCPSCGATLAIETRFAKVVVCDYCSQTSVVSAAGLSIKGSTSTLVETFSLFSVGARGALKGRSFQVMGRLRYAYARGFWEEWLLQFDDGKVGWVEEDEGAFALYESHPLPGEIASIEEVAVGQSLHIGEQRLFVTEKIEATIEGAAGQLYFRVFPGIAITCIDGIVQGGLAAIEATSDEIEFALGTPLSIDDITLDDE